MNKKENIMGITKQNYTKRVHFLFFNLFYVDIVISNAIAK